MSHQITAHLTPTAWGDTGNCPFCQKVVLERDLVQRIRHGGQYMKVVSEGDIGQRIRHVGQHMEEISFLVVPKLYEEWDFYSNLSKTEWESESASTGSHNVCTFTQCLPSLDTLNIIVE